jgi:hypothetical protein
MNVITYHGIIIGCNLSIFMKKKMFLTSHKVEQTMHNNAPYKQFCLLMLLIEPQTAAEHFVY